jgi:exopolyphosphatase/pppGpp-phosphohydrolase
MYSDDTSLWNHTLLVRGFARKLAISEGANLRVVEIASLLHDTGKSAGRENHHIVSARIAEGILQGLPIEEQEKQLILKCILKHRKRFHSEDNEIEIKVVQCADILGSLFNDWWQEHLRNTLSRESLNDMYENLLENINLESARTLARPQLNILRKLVGNTVN